MTGLVRKATLLLTVCGLLAASAAIANVPDPTQSTCPVCIYLVGNDGVGNADAADGQFVVTVKDFNGNLIPNSSVVVDFSACSDLKLCNTQDDPGITLDCPTKTVRALTNISGVATFTVEGIGFPSAGTPAYAPCATIYADGVLLCTVPVAAFDLLGGGVGASDLAQWVSDFLSGVSPARADFICDGAVGATDLSKWVSVFLGALSNSNCTGTGDVCP